MEEILAGIDVGTTKICTLIGRVEDDKTVRILGVGIEPSEGHVSETEQGEGADLLADIPLQIAVELARGLSDCYPAVQGRCWQHRPRGRSVALPGGFP